MFFFFQGWISRGGGAKRKGSLTSVEGIEEEP